jgi:hypothetical protein
MGFFLDRLAERQAQQPQPPAPAPQIRQAPRSEEERAQMLLANAQHPDARDDIMAEAEARVTGPPPAASAEGRFGVKFGQDIGTPPRRPVTVYDEDEDARQHRREVNAVAAQMQVAAGLAGPESARAKAARDQAAMVAEQIKSGTFTTSTANNTPRRATTIHGVAGSTVGMG